MIRHTGAGKYGPAGVWLGSPAGYLCLVPPAPDGPSPQGFLDIDGNGRADAVLGFPGGGFSALLFRSGHGLRVVTPPSAEGPTYCC